jgi:hypothetical protein
MRTTEEAAVVQHEDSPTTWNEMLATGRKEHQRALNRVRQQRYRNARNGNITERVTQRVERVAKAILEGKGPTQALNIAGFAGSSKTVLDSAKSVISREMSEYGINRAMLYENIVRRDKATKVIPLGETSIESPDWSAQSTAARDAIALLDRAGELPQPTQSTGSGNVTLVLQSLNVTLDVVDAHTDNEQITSNPCKNEQITSNPCKLVNP